MANWKFLRESQLNQLGNKESGENMKFILSGGSGIGDLIFYLPVVNALKMKYPGSQIDLLIRSKKNMVKNLCEILEYTTKEYIDNIYYYNSSEVFNNVKTLMKLKQKKYDYAILLSYFGQGKQIWPYRIFRLLDVPIIALKNNMTDKMKIDYPILLENVYHTNYLCNIKNIDAYFACLSCFNIIEKQDKNKYFKNLFNKEKIEKVNIPLKESIYGRYIVLCVGANPVTRKNNNTIKSNDIKSWDIKKWIILANVLVKQGFNVVLLGGKQESIRLKPFKKRLDSRINNLVGKTSIMESIAVLYNSTLVIGCDTGLMHCASALNNKTLILLGTTSEKQAKCYGESSYSISKHLECSPCFGTGRDILCKTKECMKKISVKEVLLMIKKIISKDED